MLPEDLLSALIDDGHVSVTISRLCEIMAASPKLIRRASRRLVSRGIVEAWDGNPDGPSLSLTPATADRLGLEINDDGTHWRARGAKRSPDRIGSSKVVQESQLSTDTWDFFDSLADRRTIDPVKTAIWHESARKAHMLAEEHMAFTHRSSPKRAESIESASKKVPHLTLGMNVAWPVSYVPGSRCEVCRNARGQWVCLICNCSSLDYLFGTPPKAATLQRQAIRAELAGGKGEKGRRAG